MSAIMEQHSMQERRQEFPQRDCTPFHPLTILFSLVASCLQGNHLHNNNNIQKHISWCYWIQPVYHYRVRGRVPSARLYHNQCIERRRIFSLHRVRHFPVPAVVAALKLLKPPKTSPGVTVYDTHFFFFHTNLPFPALAS